jgi:DUF4097 and DUF4098 domain-containing protein YvlB
MRLIPQGVSRRLALALVVVCWSLPAMAQTEVLQRVDAGKSGIVEITNIAGSVDVSGWDRDEVEVVGTLSRNVEKLTVEHRGGRVEISVELRKSRHDKSGRGHSDVDTQIVVRVPRASKVHIETVDATVTSKGLGGALSIESVSGSILVEKGPPELRVVTVAGSVVVRSGVESLAIETVTGSVKIHCGRKITATAVSGQIEILGAEGVEDLKLEVVAGDITFEGSLAPSGWIDASSHNGSIDIALPKSVSASFEVTTFSGQIENELGPASERVGRYTPEQEVRFQTGSGEGRVSLESFAGSITIRER